jgi:hypothetical protein
MHRTKTSGDKEGMCLSLTVRSLSIAPGHSARIHWNIHVVDLDAPCTGVVDHALLVVEAGAARPWPEVLGALVRGVALHLLEQNAVVLKYTDGVR